jgi:hypothetical protein
MTPNKRDLKAYSRFDGTGRIVPGSTVLRRNKPKNGNWKEVQAYECCDTFGACTEPLVMEVRPSEGFYEFGFRVNFPNSVKGTIDWGDGDTQTFNLTNATGSYTYFGHTYSTADYIPQTVKVFFDSLVGFDNLEIGDEAWKVLSVTNLSTVFAGSSIDQIDADESLIQSLNVSGLSIQSLYALDCPNLTYVNVQGCTQLQDTELFGADFQVLDLSGCTSLEYADVGINLNLDTVIIDDCPNIIQLDIFNANLTTANVDYILNTLSSNGLSDGFLAVDGGTSGAPSGASAAALANLSGPLNWNINTN